MYPTMEAVGAVLHGGGLITGSGAVARHALRCLFLTHPLAVAVLERPFVKRFALCYRTVVLSVCLSVLSVTLVHCGQTVGWIKMKLGMHVGLGPGHTVLEPSSPFPKGAQPANFRPVSVAAKCHLVRR